MYKIGDPSFSNLEKRVFFEEQYCMVVTSASSNRMNFNLHNALASPSTGKTFSLRREINGFLSGRERD